MALEQATNARVRLPQIVVIGNPENRRVVLFCEAAKRLGLPAPQTIAYEALLARPGEDVRTMVPEGALVRIESPGENAAVLSGLIHYGARLEGLAELPAAEASKSAAEHGRIAGSQWWFRGYGAFLKRIETELASRNVQWMNHPADIRVMFDKAACQGLLRQRGVPVPPSLAELTGRAPTNYDDLLRGLAQADWHRVFIKLRYGSSSSGVVAFERSHARVQATTSVEVVRDGAETKLFNSLRVRRYTRERDVAALVDELGHQEIHVEQWIPKAGWAGRSFDLRVLVIGGHVRHTVMRTSRGPITNLHLGNVRGDLASLLAQWPVERRELAWESCRALARAFPGSLYCGVDLALSPSLRRHVVLEANAFGDLLPGVVDAGEDTYTAELRTAIDKVT